MDALLIEAAEQYGQPRAVELRSVLAAVAEDLTVLKHYAVEPDDSV